MKSASKWTIGRPMRRLALRVQGDEARAAEAFDRAARQTHVRVLRDAFEVGRDELEFNGRAAAIKD